MAMIRIDSAAAAVRRARMLLQVHDELVFESPPDEADEVRRLVKQEMESVYSAPGAAAGGHRRRDKLERREMRRRLWRGLVCAAVSVGLLPGT